MGLAYFRSVSLEECNDDESLTGVGVTGLG